MRKGKKTIVNALVLLSPATTVLSAMLTLLRIFGRRGGKAERILDGPIYEEKRGDPEPKSETEQQQGEPPEEDSSNLVRIVGNITIPDRTQIQESMSVQGSLKIGKGCRLRGNIRSSGEVEVGEETVIEGSVFTDGKVTLRSNATVEGTIHSAEDVILKEGATAEAVSTKKSVKMSTGARVRRVVHGRTLHPAFLPPTEEAGAVASTVGRPRGFSRGEETSSSETFLEEREDGELGSDKKPAEPDLTETEARVLKLVSSGRDVDEIGLVVLLDPTQVQEVIRQLVDKKYLTEDLQPFRRKIAEEEAGRQQTEEPSAKPAEEGLKDESPSVAEIFEGLLAVKMRDELKRKATAEKKPYHENRRHDSTF